MEPEMYVSHGGRGQPPALGKLFSEAPRAPSFRVLTRCPGIIVVFSVLAPGCSLGVQR